MSDKSLPHNLDQYPRGFRRAWTKLSDVVSKANPSTVVASGQNGMVQEPVTGLNWSEVVRMADRDEGSKVKAPGQRQCDGLKLCDVWRVWNMASQDVFRPFGNKTEISNSKRGKLSRREASIRQGTQSRRIFSSDVNQAAVVWSEKARVWKARPTQASRAATIFARHLPRVMGPSLKIIGQARWLPVGSEGRRIMGAIPGGLSRPLAAVMKYGAWKHRHITILDLGLIFICFSYLSSGHDELRLSSATASTVNKWNASTPIQDTPSPHRNLGDSEGSKGPRGSGMCQSAVPDPISPNPALRRYDPTLRYLSDNLVP
ncbi:uncharacterized protein CLUP02_06010 [Colletotrichum lupini]|uniref:Uncharacterized protein n=1 Tax=Colletotrichum lupini TaxID=145971 RepID=A0A9Q8WF54_9PEZI|nr:uncharacterized protein CLUP02_06010 [Colletotrichum lupini]UQC80527.1 hypothetical protein CLUP02_06010 [Colletotrichum lupini]